jgi:hypothetical protein
MAIIQYSEVAKCGCGASLKVFASSGRTAKSCADQKCRTREKPRKKAAPKKQRPRLRCVDCGAPIWAKSQRCKACYEGRRARPAEERECKGCGKIFKRNPKKGDAARYCSRACAFSHSKTWRRKRERLPPRSRVWFRHCARCESPFVARRSEVVMCSKQCTFAASKEKRDRERAPKPPKPMALRCCLRCGVEFASQRAKRYCSKRCARYIRRKMEKALRRARGRVVAERVSPRRVFERDGWRCQICGKATPSERRGSTRSNAPELDHRVPLSKGGAHTYANTQCACRACNGVKGNKTEAGQIALFINGI